MTEQTNKSRLSDADICRANGWTVGMLVAGEEYGATTVIRITAIGDSWILAVRVDAASSEGIWTLKDRDWKPVLSAPTPGRGLAVSLPPKKTYRFSRDDSDDVDEALKLLGDKWHKPDYASHGAKPAGIAEICRQWREYKEERVVLRLNATDRRIVYDALIIRGEPLPPAAGSNQEGSAIADICRQWIDCQFGRKTA